MDHKETGYEGYRQVIWQWNRVEFSCLVNTVVDLREQLSDYQFLSEESPPCNFMELLCSYFFLILNSTT